MQENIYRVYFITFIRAKRDTHACKALFPPCLEPTFKNQQHSDRICLFTSR